MKKTSTERSSERDARMREAGLVQRKVWAYPEDWAKIYGYVSVLNCEYEEYLNLLESEGKRMDWQSKPSKFKDRNLEITRRVGYGETYEEVAKDYDMTASNVKAIVRRTCLTILNVQWNYQRACNGKPAGINLVRPRIRAAFEKGGVK